MKPPERVLLRSVNWLGDVVMTLPAIHALRRHFHDAEFHVSVAAPLASLFEAADWVDRVWPFRVRPGWRGVADRWHEARRLAAESIDLAVILPKSFDAALVPTLAGIPERAGFASNARSALLTRRAARPKDSDTHHQVHDYLRLVRETVGAEGSPEDLSLPVSESARETMRRWLSDKGHDSGRKLVALAPAAAYGPAKEWPAAHFATLIDRLATAQGAQAVLVGAPGERARCEEVAQASGQDALVAAGETDIGQGIALLSLCDAFAGNDSGSMHVAGALGLPTVGIFGSTRPERTGPLGPRVRILHEPLPCSPCLARTCRFGHTDCLARIEAGSVEQALVGLGAF